MNVEPDLFGQAAAVTSRADFLEFLLALRRDRGRHPEQWENGDLDSFLGGLHGFAGSMSGYYANAGETVDVETISWRMAAQMLFAATVYE